LNLEIELVQKSRSNLQEKIKEEGKEHFEKKDALIQKKADLEVNFFFSFSFFVKKTCLLLFHFKAFSSLLCHRPKYKNFWNKLKLSRLRKKVAMKK